MNTYRSPHDSASSTGGDAARGNALGAGPARGWLQGPRWIIWLLVGIVLGPVVARFVPREVSQWYLATGLQARIDGNEDESERALDKALEWNPDNVEVYLLRAEWRRDSGDYGAALAACEEAAQRAPDDMRVYLERSQVFQHLGQGEKAVADWKKLEELNERLDRLAEETVWNGLAYARAVANIELDKALADANRALKRRSNDAALLDTRGFIHYRLGDHQAARLDLDAALKVSEAEHAELVKRAGSSQPRLVKQSSNSLAVMLYHRALVLRALGDEDAAKADEHRVKELGFEPDDRLF